MRSAGETEVGLGGIELTDTGLRVSELFCLGLSETGLSVAGRKGVGVRRTGMCGSGVCGIGLHGVGMRRRSSIWRLS